MNRLAKPGGHLYLQTPDVHALAVRKGVERYFKLVHTYYYTPGTLTSLLHKAGFEVLTVRRRPAVLSASTLLRPGQFCVGEQDVVARKTRAVSLTEARQAPPLREDPQLTRTAVADALRRDLPYVRLNAFYRVPVLGRLTRHLVRAAFALTGRETRAADVHALQAEQLAAVPK